MTRQEFTDAALANLPYPKEIIRACLDRAFDFAPWKTLYSALDLQSLETAVRLDSMKDEDFCILVDPSKK